MTNRTSDSYEAEIRAYAYQLWEKAGRPEGRDKEFWEAAKSEVDAGGPNPPGQQPNSNILPG